MKIAYFDCFAGISGDMTLGALIGVGADVERLRAELSKLEVEGYHLEVSRKEKGHLSATDVDVAVHHHGHHHHRRLGDILEIIERSELSEWVKGVASDVFRRLADAEAVAHGTTPDKVHFHEVGAVDAIVDIVGSTICLEMIGRPKVVAGPMPTFHGFARGSHGTFPLPAPATVELLKGVPWRTLDVVGELVTPTGAAIITTIASEFGPMPAMRVESVGYGAGKQEFEFPNVLRVMLGVESDALPASDRVSIIETNIDDLNPQFYEPVMEHLFDAGALDVFLTPVQMKKNRPGTLLSVICSPDHVRDLAGIILAGTSTLGVRVSQCDRVCLDRLWQDVKTEFGSIRIKVGYSGGRVVNAAPEYDDCKRAAEDHDVTVKHVYDAAIAAYTSLTKG